MWEQSMQVEALRLLAEWWDSPRRRRAPSDRRRVVGAAVADVLVLPPGYPETPDWPQGAKLVAGPTSTGP